MLPSRHRQLNLEFIIEMKRLSSFICFLKAMAENEAKIANLQREKEELLDLVKNVGHNGKLADSRKKRVGELEAQLAELKKKVSHIFLNLFLIFSWCLR